MDTKCFWGYKPAKQMDEDFGKNKFTNAFPADIFSRQ